MSDDKSSQYVTLVSNDGYEFKILRSAACIAGTIKKALDPMCTHTAMALESSEADRCQSWLPREHPKSRRSADDKVRLYPFHVARIARIKLMRDSGVVLEKVCEYLYYNQKHAESKDVSDMDIPPELCLELLIAADYLDGRHHLVQGGVSC
jgi:transcription elongation factor B subunit 1